jgi:hypothetical protein
MQSWVSYKSFHLHDVEFGLCYYWELVFHLSWCEVTLVRIDVMVWAKLELVETIGFRLVMWFVMLESAKDWVLGVDTLGQQVPPRVKYGTTCLLIRDAMGSVPCLVEWEIGVVTRLGSHGARGLWYHCWRSYSSRPAMRNLSNALVLRTTLAKLGIQPIVNLCNDM